MKTKRTPILLTSLLFFSACGAPVDSADPESTGEIGEELIPGNYFSDVTTSVRSSLSATEGNLSAGALDFAHFTSPTTIDGGSFDGIKNFTRLGSGPYGQIPTGPLAFSWTGGSPTGSANDVRSHLRTCGAGSGFSFEFPSVPHGRTLRVFVGAQNAAAYYVAWRGGEGRTSGNLIQSANGSQFGFYDLTYSDASARSLRLELDVHQAGQTPVTNNSCVSLLAARVVDVPDTAGSVSFAGIPTIALSDSVAYGISVNATHPDGVRGVELFYDNVNIGQSTTAPYDFGVIFTPGPHKLHAEVTTTRGAVFKSAAQLVKGWYTIANNQQQSIPDAGAWVDRPLTALFTQLPPNRTVKGMVVFAAGITHPYVGDLELRLLSPTDKSVMLSQNVGGGGDNYQYTWFRDDATNPISTGVAPFEDSFRPQMPLSGMIGQPATGAKPWRFGVRDDYANDVGTFDIAYAWMLLD